MDFFKLFFSGIIFVNLYVITCFFLSGAHTMTHTPDLGHRMSLERDATGRSCRGIIAFIASDFFYLLFSKHLSWGGSLAYRLLKFCYVCCSRRIVFLLALLPPPTPHFHPYILVRTLGLESKDLISSASSAELALRLKRSRSTLLNLLSLKPNILTCFVLVLLLKFLLFIP